MKKLTIKEIKERLLQIDDFEDPFIIKCQNDERKGVQNALNQWQKTQEKKQLLIDRYHEKNIFEIEGINAGYTLVAGVDEVGRGPLAGPVVSAAVILDASKPIYGLDDSKKLSLAKRNELFDEIHQKALAIGIGIVTADEIDRSNILRATKQAMVMAINELDIQPDLLLVDAETLNISIPQKAIIKGDSKSNSIAAASIVAKVTRDRMMSEYDLEYPGYGFGSNAGYGTKVHLEGLEKYGATPIHRKSFSPVTNYL